MQQIQQEKEVLLETPHSEDDPQDRGPWRIKVRGNHDTPSLLQRNRQRSRLLTCLEAIYMSTKLVTTLIQWCPVWVLLSFRRVKCLKQTRVLSSSFGDQQPWHGKKMHAKKMKNKNYNSAGQGTQSATCAGLQQQGKSPLTSKQQRQLDIKGLGLCSGRSSHVSLTHGTPGQHRDIRYDIRIQPVSD